MTRPYRIQIEDGLYHIINRGNNRQTIYNDARDYEKFLEYVREVRDKYDLYVHAYVLMPNHYHLFIELTQSNLSRAMQTLNTAYAVYHNKRHRKSGHLFQGRYKSYIVETDMYYGELTRYIHLNPVRAKLAEDPKDYRWSSYKEYMKQNPAGLVDTGQVETYLGMKMTSYRRYVLAGIGKENKFLDYIYASSILGSDNFRKECLNEIQKDLDKGEFAYKRELSSGFTAEDIIQVVADVYGVEKLVVTGSKHSQSRAKKLAIVLLKKNTYMSSREIGTMFEISESRVSKVCKGYVELKKDKEISRALAGIKAKMSRVKV